MLFRLLIATCLTICLHASSEPYLQNIQQVTYSWMGFEKAGEAYFSPDDKSIVFQAVPSGQKQYQIFLMNLEEGIPRMVSTGRGACTCAYFRPDGKKIIFASSHDDPAENENPSVPGYKREGGEYAWDFTPFMNIYEANLDGSDLKALTFGPEYHAECAYSPDGSKIVFASNLDGSMNIYIMDADGSNIRQVTNTDDCYNGGPFFSPDGSKIIFRADREKRHYLQIMAKDADGTNEMMFTDDKYVNWAPYWYPDGKSFAYTTSRHGHDRYEVYLYNLVTNDELRLTNSPGFDGISVFNSDGSKMMWTSKRSDDKSCQIFISDLLLP